MKYGHKRELCTYLYGRILGGIPIIIVLCNFLRKIDGFEQNDSQGFENSYNSYEQYPLKKFFIFTIYQNYTLALMAKKNCFRLLDENSEFPMQIYSNCTDILLEW